jgi:magnesium transporter
LNALESLARSFVQTNPEGAAHALELLNDADAARIISRLPADEVGPTIEHLAPHAAAAILRQLGPDQTHKLLAAMTPRQAAVVLQHLEEAQREAALAGLPENAARQLRSLIQYPPETAGGLMEPRVASITNDLTVQQAVAGLRKAPRQTLYYLYVTDRQGKLVGVLNMRDLLLASPRDPIQPMVKSEIVSVPATMDREDVATIMRQRGFFALPVVDNEGLLLGIIKHDQVLDTVQQEAFEDLQKLVGAGGDESALSPVSTVFKRRLPWLYVNLVTAFMAAAVVSLFEDIIARVSALAVLLPVVSGQGGNSGSQTLAVVIRGLALREVLPGAAWRIVVKELLAGLLNGAAVAVVTAAAVLAWSRSGGLSLVIGLAMIVNMAAAAVAGAVIPLALKACGRDPAQSSSIFLTTVTDIVGFGSFLGFATLCAPLLASNG